MKAQIDLNRIGWKLQELQYRIAAVMASLAMLSVSFSRCQVEINPQLAPTPSEARFVTELTDAFGNRIGPEEQLDDIGKTRRLIAKGKSACEEMDRKGYRGKPDELKEAMRRIEERDRITAVAAVRHLCPELLEQTQ